MRLKDTTLEQRFIAGFIFVLITAYGMLAISHVYAKFRAFCETQDTPFDEEAMILRFYVLLAAAGAALICLHLWPKIPPRPPKHK